MRVLFYFAGLLVGTVVGAITVLIAGFIIDQENDE
jgi:hypothetical protein